MGNRAIITTEDRKVGLYLHWNGGRDSVEAFLAYCKMKGYRPPSEDCYGWARLCQVIGNYFGGTMSIGIDRYMGDEREDPGDNGIYVIKDWEIVDRISKDVHYGPSGYGLLEQNEYDLNEMLRDIDAAQPAREQIGEIFDAQEIKTADLTLGDEVWMQEIDNTFAAYPVVGFGKCGSCQLYEGAYVQRLDHDGDYSWNPNNFVHTDTCRIRPRK